VKFQAVMWSEKQGHDSIKAAWNWAKPLLQDGKKLAIEIRAPQRNHEQNAKLHAELQEIAESIEWFGQKRSVEVWKRLVTAAWLRARGESVEMLPALDNHGCDVVFRRTSDLTTTEMAELIEYVLAWKAENMPANS